jgi:hypothetical protein
MHFQRLLNTALGKFFISVLLGLGIATMFRKVCKDKSCMVFNGPIISELDDKIYKYGEKCYTYNTVPGKCDNTKQIVNIKTPEDDHDNNPVTAKILPLVSNMSTSPSASPSSIFTMFNQ